MEKLTKASKYLILDKNVLVVATTRVEGWTAYIGAVPGINHSMEWNDVLDQGTELSESLARVIFGNDPRFGSFVDYCS